ncbi:hypothetical protein ACMD2_26058, partial [Ananas comosus]
RRTSAASLPSSPAFALRSPNYASSSAICPLSARSKRTSTASSAPSAPSTSASSPAPSHGYIDWVLHEESLSGASNEAHHSQDIQVNLGSTNVQDPIGRCYVKIVSTGPRRELV